MHFYLPRRHRRRLLLPPGLVALAGLLLLGCLALRPWQERLKRPTVIELRMPILQARHSALAFSFEPEKLPPFDAWYNSYFDGSHCGDVRRAHGIANQAAAMQATPSRDQRLRVKLGPQATYAEMVFLLNIMSHFNIKKYAFDIRREPVTFYAFTKLPSIRHRRSVAPVVAEPEYPTAFRFYPSPSDQAASYRTRLRHWQDACRAYGHGRD